MPKQHRSPAGERRVAEQAPELVGEGVIAGSVDEVVEEIRALVAAGLRHVVFWNVGPLASCAGPADLPRLGYSCAGCDGCLSNP